MGDYFTEDPARLKGKPKKTLAVYAEQRGIAVPRRFSSLDEAVNSELPFIARSERTEDYAGESDILRSVESERIPRGATEKQVIEKVLEGHAWREYCQLKGISEADFRRGVSVSYWEFLRGENITVAADSAVPDRFHILTNIHDLKHGVLIIEKGQPILEHEVGKEVIANAAAVIDLYQTVRNLLESNHCSIQEMQLSRGRVYFLQNHRGRDFWRPDGFVLNRPLRGKEIEAQFVRGATTQSGITVETTFSYALCDDIKSPAALPKEEHGSFDLAPVSRVYSELMCRSRRLQVISGRKSLGETLAYASGHAKASRLFKPEVTIAIPLRQLVSEQEYRELNRLATEKGQDVKITLHATSDGRRAYVERLA